MMLTALVVGIAFAIVAAVGQIGGAINGSPSPARTIYSGMAFVDDAKITGANNNGYGALEGLEGNEVGRSNLDDFSRNVPTALDDARATAGDGWNAEPNSPATRHTIGVNHDTVEQKSHFWSGGQTSIPAALDDARTMAGDGRHVFIAKNPNAVPEPQDIIWG